MTHQEEKLQKLVGKKIAKVTEVKPEKGSSYPRIEFEDGDVLEIKTNGGPGADSEWYDYLSLELTGDEIFRG